MTGRRYAQVGVVFGLAVSTWANVAQAWPHGWGARLMSAVWPTILYLSLEVLARVVWAGRVGKWASRVAAGVVGLVAAVLSYQHLHGLLQHYGEGGLSAALGPLGIDGLMAVCAAALLTREPVEVETPAVEPVAVAEPAPAATAAPAVVVVEAPEPAPKRKVNGKDLRIIEVVALVQRERAAGRPDPNPNQVAKHVSAKWETGQRLLQAALAELDGAR